MAELEELLLEYTSYVIRDLVPDGRDSGGMLEWPPLAEALLCGLSPE